MENNGTAEAMASEKTTTTVSFSITHNISSSKGWGRYKVAGPKGPVVKSSTDNEWVSAPHSGSVEDGQEIVATLQTMKRVGARKEQKINTTDYRLIVEYGATATLGFFDGLEVSVLNARRIA